MSENPPMDARSPRKSLPNLLAIAVACFFLGALLANPLSAGEMRRPTSAGLDTQAFCAGMYTGCQCDTACTARWEVSCTGQSSPCTNCVRCFVSIEINCGAFGGATSNDNPVACASTTTVEISFCTNKTCYLSPKAGKTWCSVEGGSSATCTANFNFVCYCP